MLSEEFVAARVFEGDERRRVRERELVRRSREQKAERRMARAARGAGATPAAPVAPAAPVTPVAPVTVPPAEALEVAREAARMAERELQHAGR